MKRWIKDCVFGVSEGSNESWKACKLTMGSIQQESIKVAFTTYPPTVCVHWAGH